MYPSKFTMWGLLVVTLAVALWGLGSPALQAKDNDQHSCGCPAPVVRPYCPAPVVRPCCPAPVVRQKPSPCCPAPVVRQKPCGPAPTSCCPVDPKDK